MSIRCDRNKDMDHKRYRRLEAGKKVYAILAPATEGQFGKDITMEAGDRQ